MKISILILVLFSCLFAYGQKWEKDTTAIESFVDKFNVKINFDSQTESFFTENFQGGPDIKLETSYGSSLSLSLDFEIIGLSLGFSPSFLPGNGNEELKGESSFFDIQPRIAINKWLIELRYRKVTGFYVENTEEFIPDWEENTDPYILIPDFSNTLYGIKVSHIFNPNFSYKNIFFQTERQRKSAGSFIPSFQYGYNKVSFSQDDTKYRDNSSDLSLSMAYVYTLVIGDNWFVSPNLAPLAGISFSNSETTIGTTVTKDNITYFMTGLESGLQLGFASKKVIFGLKYNYDLYWYQGQERTFVDNNRTYGLLYVGYRFNAPRFVAKPYDKFSKTKFAKKLGI